MKHLLLAAAAALSFAVPVTGQDAAIPAVGPSPGDVVATASPTEWIAIAPSDLLVMDLAPDARGKPRRVVIQLMPAPFSGGWIGNIRKLAAAHWWDGTSVNRVQDNYVTQWGDATEKKPLPEGLAVVPESEYTARAPSAGVRLRGDHRDPYAADTGFYAGWPIAVDAAGPQRSAWPVHCYGMVGVGRNLTPDTGTGAELYTVIGHAPRHLDRNIALVGRIISGMEYLSSLPRGTAAMSFYDDAAQRVPIISVRLASELAAGDQPRFEYLSTDGATFTKYAGVRENRRDPFFQVPAGGADICSITVPIRAIATEE